MEEKFVLIEPSALSIEINPISGKIGVLFGAPDEELGLAPNVKLALELTPDQARELAARIIQKTLEADAARRPH